MTEENSVKPCEFTCAKAFLDALDETNGLWRGETWLFRGQSVDRPLLPTAMRHCKIIDDIVSSRYERMLENATTDANLKKMIADDFEDEYRDFRESANHTRLVVEALRQNQYSITREQAAQIVDSKFLNIFRSNYVKTILQRTAEVFTVSAFVELSDQSGLTIPRDSAREYHWERPFPFSNKIALLYSSDAQPGWNNPDLFAGIIFALARHHNVPTRLLDCTYRPLVAAFFAAQTPDRPCQESDHSIVVWAVHQNSLLPTGIRVVKHRRSEIGYLQAQDGAFMYDTRADEKFWFAGEWSPLDESFVELASKRNAFKLMLANEKRRELLDMLALKGISKPTLMPSYDNAAEEIQSEHFDLVGYLENRV